MNQVGKFWAIIVAVFVAAASVVTVTSYMVISSDDSTNPSTGGLLDSFHGYDDLFALLEKGVDGGGYGYSIWDTNMAERSTYGSTDDRDYSSTNVQVEGIDELDFVKTDGERIFLSSYANITILEAYPPEDMAVNAVIDIGGICPADIDANDMSISGMFISGDKLVVISSANRWYQYYGYYDYHILSLSELSDGFSDTELREGESFTFVSVLDISDIDDPVLQYTKGMSGWLIDARMTAECAYIVSQEYSLKYDENDFLIPRTYSNGIFELMPPEDINFDPETEECGQFLNIMSIELESGDGESESIVTDSYAQMYMSHSAIYLAMPKWIETFIGNDMANDTFNITTWRTVTTIHKIEVSGTELRVSARGDVEGRLLNQFSMDEKAPYLRIATTEDETERTNNVFVLNEDLEIIGSLEGLAPTERIYSARFMGDMLYLVTFRQIDPLFAIDLSDPEHPEVLGELKIPGFSNYLHPVGETHLIGVGQQDSKIKISLFDVTDPTMPFEVDNYTTEKNGYSAALYDHKAVLFDVERSRLVIPFYYEDISNERHYAYWQHCSEALVFDISVDSGISLFGRIDQTSNNDVQRSLYIDDALYTISDSDIQANGYDDLSFIRSLLYGGYSYDYRPILYLE
ncbi:MAG TPA: hypothetical protein ENN25_05090 [Euryarchaeota archaeon]|nr:hypothetical protein [Euryarchaeota archaeon]